ncbi:MAG: cache domain-containing protein, partial [Oscillospiraceae bacterium]
MKKKKLATRLCIIMAFLVSGLFAILITTTALNIGKNVSKIVSDEFDEMSLNSANQVQAILDTAKNSAISLTDYIAYTYENQDKLSAEELAETRLSDVFSVPLQPQNYDMEKFIIGTERSVVKNNEDIVGMGAFFEPKMFDPGITDYTIYMNEENVKEKKVHPYGAYRTYKDREFYRVALETKKPYVTAPYEQGGILIVSYCQPIIVNDKAVGVVM